MRTGTVSKKLSGFTLVEMVVALGVFAIMTTALSASFASGFASFGNSREIQRDTDAVQHAMNTISKLLRTGTVVSSFSSNAQSIVFYDYSSKSCYEYSITGSILKARWKRDITVQRSVDAAGIITSDVKSVCNTTALASSAWSDMTSGTGLVTGRFAIDPSKNITEGGPHVGKVVMYLSVTRAGAPSSLRSTIQTTVSLRDYDYAQTGS